LIQQIAHDLEQDPGALGVHVRLMRPRIGVAAEQHRAERAEGFVVQLPEIFDLLQGVEQLEFAALAELAKQRLRRQPAHGAEGVEAAGAVAGQSLLEQSLGLLRQIGEREGFARPLDLDIGRGEIDFFRRVGLGGEFQKDRFAAGVAAEYHADALGFLPAELLEFWRRREGEVAQGLTMRTIEHDPRILQLQFILRRKRDAHAQPVRGL